mgnify:FL=1
MVRAQGLILILLTVAKGGYVYPEQIHLSMTANPNEMKVTWVTFLAANTVVKYRPVLCHEFLDDWLVKKGNYTAFKTGRGCWRTEYIHEVVLQGLNPDCKYQYQVGNGWAWSDTYIFKGRTNGFIDENPMEVVVFGDWGIDATAEPSLDLLLELTQEHDLTAIMHTGDISYNLNYLNGRYGDKFLEMVEPIATKHPYMTLPGNHDKAGNYSHYKHRFRMPWNEYNEGTGYFYSLDLGRIHFVMLNTEVYLDKDKIDSANVQTEWLKKDLQSANENRQERPWIVVMSHHPLYCSYNWALKPKSSDCMEDTLILRGYLEEIFNENSVDIYFQAHVHNYERNAPIYNNLTIESETYNLNYELNPKAPIYVTAGNAGNVLEHNDPPSPFPHNWVRCLTDEYGIGRLVAYNSTHLYWEQYSSPLKTVIDHLLIVKERFKY